MCRDAGRVCIVRRKCLNPREPQAKRLYYFDVNASRNFFSDTAYQGLRIDTPVAVAGVSFVSNCRSRLSRLAQCEDLVR